MNDYSRRPFSAVLNRRAPAIIAALALAGCHSPARMPIATNNAAAGLGPYAALQTVPPCEHDAEATLSDGIDLAYQGADPNDPMVCLVAWNGRTYRFFAGFWGAGRFRSGTAAERAAIAHVLAGPVGAKASFADVRTELWGKVTIEHAANPVLRLENGPRATVLLRVIKYDQRNRPGVQAETLHWIDAESGVVLKQETVTTMAGGRKARTTTWQIERLDTSAPPSTTG